MTQQAHRLRNIQDMGFSPHDSGQPTLGAGSTMVTRTVHMRIGWRVEVGEKNKIQGSAMTHNHSKILMVQSFNEPSLK